VRNQLTAGSTGCPQIVGRDLRVCGATIVLARLRSVSAMSGVSVQARPSVMLMAIPGARLRSYSRCRLAFPGATAPGRRAQPGTGGCLAVPFAIGAEW
jgi:hypothetical protein